MSDNQQKAKSAEETKLKCMDCAHEFEYFELVIYKRKQKCPSCGSVHYDFIDQSFKNKAIDKIHIGILKKQVTILQSQNEKLVKENEEAMQLVLSQSSSIIDLMHENEKLKEYSNTFKSLELEKRAKKAEAENKVLIERLKPKPKGSANIVFEEFWKNIQTEILELKEIASLAFDAGHALWHKTEEEKTNKILFALEAKTKENNQLRYYLEKALQQIKQSHIAGENSEWKYFEEAEQFIKS